MIRTRLKEAACLYDNEFYEGALISVLLAVAGVSRLRCPKLKDGAAFRAVMSAVMPEDKRKFLIGKKHYTLAAFCYKFLRCNLVHEAKLPKEVVYKSAKHCNTARMDVCNGGCGRMVLDHPMVLVIGYKLCIFEPSLNDLSELFTKKQKCN